VLHLAYHGQADLDDPLASRLLLSRSATLTVLGCPRLHWTPASASEDGAPADVTAREITAAFPPRQRELLVFLALHPDGVHRDTLIAALWHDNPPQRPTNALNTALSRLRRALSQATDGALSDLITIGQSRYQLDPRLVTVDYWGLADAVACGCRKPRPCAVTCIVASPAEGHRTGHARIIRRAPATVLPRPHRHGHAPAVTANEQRR
jgi:hypothetical protein